MKPDTPGVGSPYQLCPWCLRGVGVVTLYGAWICEDCRTRFVGRRLLAFIIDCGVCLILSGCLAIPLGGMPFLVLVPVLFLLRDGLPLPPPGKAVLGLRVVNEETRRGTGLVASILRNFSLLVPGLVFVELVLLARGKRLGDSCAGTMVIWRQYARRHPFGRPDRYCRVCDYDLTGNVSGRCPECGAEIPEGIREQLALQVPETCKRRSG